MNKVDCQVPCALLKAIVRAFLATKSFTAGSSTYPFHMACISKSVLRDVISLSNCRPQWLRSTVDETRNSRGRLLSVPSCVLQGSQVCKVSFDGTAFPCGFLVKKGRRSQYFNKTGLLRNALLVNQKNSVSCRCICRKLRVERNSCNDVTCFSNGFCDVVERLVETALRPLSFSWKVLGGRVSPM